MKKKLIIAAAVGAIAAAAVPAMALENEFHGMYKFMGFQSNFFNGATYNSAQAVGNLEKDAPSGFFAEQRARLQYIAKANDNLKLVTHFELDTRFGGSGTVSGRYQSNDSGQLDADDVTLETKSIYLDFNCPLTGTNMKVGMQPWADAYGSLFLLADMTGVYATKRFDAFTGSLGWFRFDDNTIATQGNPGQTTADLIVLDGKFAVNKDIKVGASYYNVQNDTGTYGTATTPSYELLHMVGINADMTFGPATIKPMFAYQWGDNRDTATDNSDISAFMGGVVAKIKAGPGAVNFSAIYMSGDEEGAVANDDRDDFRVVTANTTYFNPANMWLLIRSGQQINSSTSVLGNDMTVDGRGTWGVFAGYEGTMDKLFYNANIGYMKTVEERTADQGQTIGTEINAQVGYKLFDNLNVSAAVAYAFLGDLFDGVGSATGDDADDPYMFNVQLSYVF